MPVIFSLLCRKNVAEANRGRSQMSRNEDNRHSAAENTEVGVILSIPSNGTSFALGMGVSGVVVETSRLVRLSEKHSARSFMTFLNTLQRNWRRLVNLDTEKERRRQLCEELCALYCAEARDAAQFSAHARQMYYPQFRDRLLRIAAEEQEHVSWLRQQIRALGGDVPQLTASPRLGQNSWECLLLDLEKEKSSYAQLLKQTPRAASIDPTLAEGLQRLRADEQRHHEELHDMWMKSDPYTPPMPKAPHPELEPQKQAWLDRQQDEWFARERADWEATGRLVTWAEWEGELEKRWMVNELPSLELRWERQVAEAELARKEHALKRSFVDNSTTII